MHDCIFCKIIKNEIQSNIIYNGKLSIAFEDINPQAPHHIVIIPKRHMVAISEADKNELEEIFSAVDIIAKQLNINDSGFRLVVNQGKDAGQFVPHLHFHLLGGRKLNWPPG
ncbi:MAG: Hit-like protein involved in cell-cycle regulation [Candidatus Saganbacteria bacterium]|uniref:Hit-like protein involved in cell-cycle regulation n=1 Tax=Candidatus Saganbacteria bacterium TaxID=2575572 RepID=A0A833L1Q0_UNCSA|nr:MAG: Hit-like protein involved in cell-cycle regulation [Candidatus Saganbacteria bacterium]